MHSNEFGPEMSDELAFRQGVRDLGGLFGLKGFNVVVQPGAGWQCIKSSQGITLVVDPEQLTERYQTEQPDGAEAAAGSEAKATEFDSRYTLYGAAHELGHGKDFADPEWQQVEKQMGTTKSDAFFWNVVDDTVINTRLRRVPMLDSVTDEIYGGILFPNDDLTDAPKHVQFMYGMLLGTVTNNPMPKIDPVAAEKLEALRDYESNGQVFDIFITLADPRTSLKERHAIADQFIKPVYEELREEDRQEQDEQSGGGEQSEEGFNQQYQDYEQTMHGDGHEHSEEETGDISRNEGQPDNSEGDDAGDTKGESDEDDGNGSDGDRSQDGDSDAPQENGGDQGEGEENKDDESGDGDDTEGQDGDKPSHAEQIAAVLKEAAEEEAREQASRHAESREPSSSTDREATMANLAGTVAQEMDLDHSDAGQYVESLDRWGQTIRDTAEVFLQLAAPTTSTMSPRYDTQAMSEGIRLHPQRLAKAALQLEIDREQSIWQPVERRANRENLAFGGLDVHLLVDVSGSMAYDGKAKSAAACAQILLEGLQLARYKTMQAGSQLQLPDVKTQVIAFGSSSEILAPLALEPAETEKGAVFSSLLYPNSGSTLIGGALAHVHEAAAAHPERESIAVIISDGIFGDFESAERQVAGLPPRAYVAHIIIGGETDEFISPNHQKVLSPMDLPRSLYEVLASQIQRMKVD